MNTKRKASGRRGASETVNLEVDTVLNMHSDVVARVVAEVNRGHSVTISPRHMRAREKLQNSTDEPTSSRPSSSTEHFNMSFSDVATTLGGGAALGLTSLAVAPTSILVAGVAVLIGAAISGIAAKKIDRQEGEL